MKHVLFLVLCPSLSFGQRSANAQYAEVFIPSGKVVPPFLLPLNMSEYHDSHPEARTFLETSREFVKENTQSGEAAGRFTSQSQQDVTIHRILEYKKEGTFIDLAANEPVWLSNSRALERDHDWKGLCIEANPYYLVALALQRSCTVVNAAIADSIGHLKFRNPKSRNRGSAREGGLVGDGFDLKGGCAPGVCDEFDAHTVPLSVVLSELKDFPKRVDYFSLDIEGAEFIAMKSFPFETHRFTVMTVERPKVKLQDLLKHHGYRYVCDHGNFGDQMWVDNTIHVPTEKLLIRAGVTRVLPFGKKDWKKDGLRCDTHANHPGFRGDGELGATIQSGSGSEAI
mmetsp:Transcript_58774/g.118051  ORF Transcript_58774/g.118051 Transcript_58774/m.118051 type:complete len:341 (-) Transcript_58774:112-1134(-)